MAMSRILAQSLPRSSLAPPTALFGLPRHRSTKAHHAQLIEIDTDQPDTPEAAAEVIAFGIRKLEDAIHSIIVRRAAPDWLPFLPGYSYWVPPRASASLRPDQPAGGMIEVIGKLASSDLVRSRPPALDLLSDDEHKAFSSTKGWPSSEFFLHGANGKIFYNGFILIRGKTIRTSPVHPIPMVNLEMKLQDNDDQVNSRSDSEDEQ